MKIIGCALAAALAYYLVWAFVAWDMLWLFTVLGPVDPVSRFFLIIFWVFAIAGGASIGEQWAEASVTEQQNPSRHTSGPVAASVAAQEDDK